MIDADDDIELGRRSTLLDWIKGLGLPVASLFVSAAIFMFQSQQQAFERQLSNIEDGYRFYFEHRTNLERHGDADQEETLLKLISSAFPNVFCYVRADLHARVAAAEALDTPNGFDENDRQMLLVMINSRNAPERMPLSGEAELPLFWKKSTTPPKCEALDAPSQIASSQPTAIIDELPAAVAPAPAASSADSAPATGAAESGKNADAALAGSAKDAEQGAAAAAAPTVATSAPTIDSKVRSLARVLDGRLFRVFFQISNTGARSPESIDPLRAQLARSGFRVMRGVEQMASVPSRAEVRYFGPDEEARAQNLAAVLHAQFKSEGLTFSTVAIGDKYPTMPRTTLEVWLPDPAGGAPVRAAETPKAEASDALSKALLNKAKPALKQGL